MTAIESEEYAPPPMTREGNLLADGFVQAREPEYLFVKRYGWFDLLVYIISADVVLITTRPDWSWSDDAQSQVNVKKQRVEALCDPKAASQAGRNVS